jgi:hypothetical protein
MWPEIKTRRCFLRLADGADAARRPAPALVRRPATNSPASIVDGVPASRREVRAVSCRRSSLTTGRSPRATSFLIGTPRLEFRATATNQRTDPISNRDRSGCFCQPRSYALFLRPVPHGRAARTASFPPVAGIPAGAFAFSSVITYHPSSITRFLIYGAAIRNPRNALKT